MVNNSLGDRSTAIHGYVERNGTTRPADVAAEFDMSVDDAGKYLRRLAAAGLISKQGRGVYGSTSEPSEVVADSTNAETDTPDTSDTCPNCNWSTGSVAHRVRCQGYTAPDPDVIPVESVQRVVPVREYVFCSNCERELLHPKSIERGICYPCRTKEHEQEITR